MNLMSKKTFAALNYEKCDPKTCDPESGLCPAVPSCDHKVLKQLDGPFESPMVFQDICMGCWDCIEACSLGAIEVKHMGS
jgi:ATP-binding cassette subfamily E protein 1